MSPQKYTSSVPLSHLAFEPSARFLRLIYFLRSSRFFRKFGFVSSRSQEHHFQCNSTNIRIVRRSIPLPLLANISLSALASEDSARAYLPPRQLNDNSSSLRQPMRHLDRVAVINLLLLAYADVSICINAGDGMIPRSADPFHQATLLGAYTKIDTVNPGDQAVGWNERGDTQLGLGDYMVMRKHLFAIRERSCGRMMGYSTSMRLMYRDRIMTLYSVSKLAVIDV